MVSTCTGDKPVATCQPVSGGGAGAGNRWGYALGDFDSFTWDSANGTLAANVVPGPFGMLAFAGFGMARRRRNR